MKILLPIYGYDDAKLIMDFVSNFNWPPHARFKLIHVVTAQEGEETEVQAEKMASVLLADILSRLQIVMSAIVADCKLISGMPILEIVNLASEWQADMIVMGSHTRTDIKDCFTGSVSKGVVMEAPCSVVTIKAPPKYFGYPSQSNQDFVDESDVSNYRESEEVHALTG